MYRRKIAYAFLILLLALFLAIGAAFIFIEREVSKKDFRTRLETAASDFLGRPLTIDSLEWKRWPMWQLTGRGVQLWNDPDKSTVLIAAPTVEARITLLSVYKAAIGVSDIHLLSPAYVAARDIKGRNNLLGMIEDIKNRPAAKPRTRGKIFFYHLSITNGLFVINGTTITVNKGTVGLITGKSRFEGVLNNPSIESEYSVSVTPGHDTRAAIQLPMTRVGALSLSDITATLHVRENVFTLDSTSFTCLGGTLAVSGSYAPAKSTDSLRVSWVGENIDIAEMARVWASSQSFGGRLNTAGELTTAPGENYVPQLNGILSAQLLDGWFPGKRGTRVPYDETRGTINIKNGIAVSTAPITLRHKTMEAAFMGSLDLSQKTIDGKMIVNMFLGTSDFIGRIPLVRDILLGDEKGLVPIWMRITGTINDPTVDILSTKAIATPVWNTIANTLKLPGRFLNKLTGK